MHEELTQSSNGVVGGILLNAASYDMPTITSPSSLNDATCDFALTCHVGSAARLLSSSCISSCACTFACVVNAVQPEPERSARLKPVKRVVAVFIKNWAASGDRASSVLTQLRGWGTQYGSTSRSRSSWSQASRTLDSRAHLEKPSIHELCERL